MGAGGIGTAAPRHGGSPRCGTGGRGDAAHGRGTGGMAVRHRRSRRCGTWAGLPKSENVVPAPRPSSEPARRRTHVPGEARRRVSHLVLRFRSAGVGAQTARGRVSLDLADVHRHRLTHPLGPGLVPQERTIAARSLYLGHAPRLSGIQRPEYPAKVRLAPATRGAPPTERWACPSRAGHGRPLGGETVYRAERPVRGRRDRYEARGPWSRPAMPHGPPDRVPVRRCSTRRPRRGDGVPPAVVRRSGERGPCRVSCAVRTSR